MVDREKVIKETEDGIAFAESRGFGGLADTMRNALALLKEQEALLNKACETIADMDFEYFCDDLMCDDGWCEENCKTSGTQPKCIERWLRKQVEQTNT